MTDRGDGFDARERVGPYRLDELLGRGGMGAVYRGWDTRLDRWVAIKKLRTGRTGNAEARRRLRAEARAVAALNHPVIVQVHDLLERPDNDWLVMELIPGETLASRIRRVGSLPAGEVAEIGHRIAEGLAVAHAAGVIHRDLKSENVMLTPDGGVKVLDFGVAYRGEPGGSTRGGGGTLRSMAPEQAAGREIDGRADLFALGVLLYEAATGVSPFLGADRKETLERLLTHAHEPLPKTLPPALRETLDGLLEKDVERRKQSASAVARELAAIRNETTEAGGSTPELSTAESVGPGLGSGTTQAWPRLHPASGTYDPASRRVLYPPKALPWIGLVTVVIALAAVGFWARRADIAVAAPPPRLHVVVPDVEVVGADDSSPVALSVHAALFRGLAGIEGLAPVDPGLTREVADLDDVRAMARALAVEEAITSRLECTAAAACQVTLSRWVARDGTIRWSRVVPILPDRPLLAAEALAGALAEAYPERSASRPDPVHADADVWRRYVRLVNEFEHPEDGEIEPLLAEAEALRRRAPEFAEAHLLEARMYLHRYRQHREPRALEALDERLAAVRSLDRQSLDPERLRLEAQTAIAARRFDVARSRIEALERLQPGTAEVMALRGDLLDARGDTAAALEAYETAARLHPAWTRLLNLAEIAYRAGDTELARDAVARSLARRPDSFYARSLQAQIELLYGDPVRARTLYRDLVERRPDGIELINLGLSHLLLRDYPEAVQAFLRARDLQPEDPVVWLNLADVLSLSGRRGEADETYRRVLTLVPPGSREPQELSMRAQALAHLGETEAAREEIAGALAAAPDNPQVAYEGALVLTLIGDYEEAARHAEAALAEGVESRWLELAWFDPLRERGLLG